jgi:cytochrome c553
VKKAVLPMRKHRAASIATLAAFVFICAAVPWPAFPVKRPLLRRLGAAAGPTAPASARSCPPTYDSRCASCHGASGRADGTLAPSLTPRPRNFRDSGWQASRTDDELRMVIREGGPAVGRSPLMPAHRDLTAIEIDALTACIRTFR